MKLPQNDNGYKVYARITGKPTFNPSFSTSSELAYVEDESGDDLLYLGLVDSNGVFSSSGVDLNRTSTATKGKKVQSATDITGLFEYTGNVCYLQQESDMYCIDKNGINTCTQKNLCCVDSNADGALECPLVDSNGTLIMLPLLLNARITIMSGYSILETMSAYYGTLTIAVPTMFK